MNEHLRFSKLKNDLALDDKALVLKAVEIYNDTIHTTIGAKPNELLHNKVDTSIWQKLHDKIHEEKVKRIGRTNNNRENFHDFRKNKFVKNLGFYNLKQKPRYIIKEVKESNKTNFIDDKNCKRDRQIVKRILNTKMKYQMQNLIKK